MNFVNQLLFLISALMLHSVGMTQILDYNSRKEILTSNGESLILYHDISDEKAYYYLPGPSNVSLSKNEKGEPTFLFMKYTEDQEGNDKVTGALLHLLLELNMNDSELQKANLLLSEEVLNARIIGPALAKSSGIKIVSGAMHKGEQIISTGRAPTLAGGKSAIALRLDADQSRLILAAFEQEQSDLSILLSYSINFGILKEGILNRTFKQEYEIVVDPKKWYQALKLNPKFVSGVNLNDPFFQSQEVKFIIDFESIDLFENFINFVDVTVKKARKKDFDFINSFIIDKNYLASAGKLASISFAKGNDPSPYFQYRINWSLIGGKTFPKMPDWFTSDFPVITLVAPFQSLETEIETAYDKLKDLNIRRVVVELKGKLAGEEHKVFSWSFTTSKEIPVVNDQVYFDKNDPIDYRVHWFHAERGKWVGDWQTLEDDYLWLEIPDELNSTLTTSNFPMPLQNPDDQSAALNNSNIKTTHQHYGLLFAVNDYKQKGFYHPLVNPIKDAELLAKELSENYGFVVEIVRNPDRVTLRDKIGEYHDKFQNGSFDPEGQLFLFFSGHGDFEELSRNGCFLPGDAQNDDLGATAFQYSYWRPRIDNIPCKHILVAIDACYSGTFDEAIAMRSGGRFTRPNELTTDESFIQDFQERKTRLYLVSGGKEKTPDKSSFAKKILEGLRSNSPSSLLTIGQLYENYVRKTRPLPLLGEFGTDEAGSNFIFIKK